MRGLVVHGAHRVGFRTVPSAWSTQIMVGYSMVRFKVLEAVAVAVGVLGNSGGILCVCRKYPSRGGPTDISEMKLMRWRLKGDSNSWSREMIEV